MKYILDEEEYRALKQQQAYDIKLKKDKLQALCTTIADTMPITISWSNNKDAKPEPWGCILSTEYEHYCDECPVESICPQDSKSWSK